MPPSILKKHMRESNWIEKILNNLKEVDQDGPHFSILAAGAAHFIPGKDRLLSVFEERGWIVKRLDLNSPDDLKNLMNMIHERQSTILSNPDIIENSISLVLNSSNTN